MRTRLRFAETAILALIGCTAPALAQMIDTNSLPVDLPPGPAKAGFDIDRFTNVGNGWFETFLVNETRPLTSVLEAGEVTNESRLLLLETAAGPLALLIDQMGYHHIAQGNAGGKDWMATF